MLEKFSFVKNIDLKSIALGLLVALLVLGGSLLITNLVYHQKENRKRGFEIALTNQKVAANQTGAKSAESVAAPKAAVVDIKTLIKTADFDAGAKIFKKCATCHSAEKSGGNKIGPNLFGIVGRKRASIPGFSYSDAMKAKGGSWSYEDLDKFLTKPKDFVPGTKMGFAGISKDKDRADLILFLEKSAK